MPWHYKLFVVRSGGNWALEIEDDSSERELLQQFPSIDAASEHARALCLQLTETGDYAEVHFQG